MSDADVERVLTLTLEQKPADATHWSTRSLAERTGLSRASIPDSPAEAMKGKLGGCVVRVGATE